MVSSSLCLLYMTYSSSSSSLHDSQGLSQCGLVSSFATISYVLHLKFYEPDEFHLWTCWLWSTWATCKWRRPGGTWVYVPKGQMRSLDQWWRFNDDFKGPLPDPIPLCLFSTSTTLGHWRDNTKAPQAVMGTNTKDGYHWHSERVAEYVGKSECVESLKRTHSRTLRNASILGGGLHQECCLRYPDSFMIHIKRPSFHICGSFLAFLVFSEDTKF